MQRINFSNLPSQTTPINATNLNLLQDNVDNGKVDKSITEYAGDLNSLETTGYYTTTSNTTNKPTNDNYYVEVIRQSTGYILQRATIRTSNSAYFNTYIRECFNGTWTAWEAFPITTTNSNGTSVRFPNGTQICYLNITVTDQAINTEYGGQGSGIYFGQRTWTFPQAFYGTPVVTCGVFRWGTSGSFGNCGVASSTTVNLMGMDFFSRASGTNCYIQAMAIGRWKA